MRRRILLAANWKMNKSLKELAEYVGVLEQQGLLKKKEWIDVMLAVPSPFLLSAQQALGATAIKVAAQNVHWEEKGAFTGEISLPMLQEIGVQDVIIGHSERRQYFAENDAMIAKKLLACTKHKVRAILCIGESLEQRQRNETFAILSEQIHKGLSGQTSLEFLTIAYEPVWAIGTGVSASVYQAQEAHAYIRNEIRNMFGAKAADQLLILYGGSMNATNVAELIQQTDIDGGLVGGASLDAGTFSEMINAIRV